MSLNDDDRTWISGQLDSRLERLEARFDAKLEALDIKIERVETTLLTEFQKWASPNEARVRTHTAALRAIDLELEAVSDRVTKLEDTRSH